NAQRSTLNLAGLLSWKLEVGRWTLDVFWQHPYDAHSPSFSDRFRGVVFHRPACGIEPAPRHFHSDRNRNDARSSEPEFHRVLAFHSAAPPTNWCNDRNLLNRDLRC